MSAWTDDRGQAAVLVAVLMLGFLALLGVLTDSGRVLAARRNLADLADAAARAGADSVNASSFRQPGTQELVLNQVTAAQAARSYLAQVGYRGEVSVATGPTAVKVRLDQHQPTTFARLFGIASVDVQAYSVADLVGVGTGVPGG
jgi:Flp pilus assembly protein TadG